MNASWSGAGNCSVIGFSAGHLMKVCMTVSLDKKNSPNGERWCLYTPQVVSGGSSSGEEVFAARWMSSMSLALRRRPVDHAVGDSEFATLDCPGDHSPKMLAGLGGNSAET